MLTPNYWNQRDHDKERAMLASLIVRRELLNTALADPNVAAQPMFRGEEPIRYLQENLRIEPVSAELMQVSLEGRDAEELLIVLKAVNAAFMKAVYDREIVRRRERLLNVSTLLHEQYAVSKSLKEKVAPSEMERADLENAEIAIGKLNAELGTMRLEMNTPVRVACWEEPHTVKGIAGHRRRDTALAVAGGVLALGFVARILAIGANKRSTIA
jgi:hypothetical protein